MNKLPTEKRTQILQMLCEGSSMRSISRIVGVSINTVSKFLADAGMACAEYQDKHLRNLTCKRLQVDEIWSFVYAKAKNVPEKKQGEAGDIWTWTAIDADTKLVPTWLIGQRDFQHAKLFIRDLADRLMFRVQLTSDGFRAYLQAVEEGFGENVDFAQLVKIYGGEVGSEKRYSSDTCIGAKPQVIRGNPQMGHVSTSFVERQNLSMRMGMRRFTRLTNAFSKKIENHYYALAIYFMYYNFVRVHKTLRTSPAVAAGVSEKLWSPEDVIEVIDQWEAAKKSN